MLIGERVRLRPARETDLDTIFRLRGETRTTGEHWRVRLQSEFLERRQFLETGWWSEDRGFLVILDGAERILGRITYFRPTFYLDTYEIGYRIYRPNDRGKGYTTEAVALLTDYLFASKPIRRIQAATLPANMASRRVLEKCGFSLEGIMRGAFFYQGAFQDLCLYAVLSETRKS